MAGRGRKRINPIGAFESHVKEINKQIKDGVLKNQKNAARYLVKELKLAVSTKHPEGEHSWPGEPPGKMSGDLQKGIGFAHNKHAQDIETMVGFHRPAHHAHLMEFGTDARYHADGSYSGKQDARPFFVKTIMGSIERTKEILSEPVL